MRGGENMIDAIFEKTARQRAKQYPCGVALPLGAMLVAIPLANGSTLSIWVAGWAGWWGLRETLVRCGRCCIAAISGPVSTGHDPGRCWAMGPACFVAWEQGPGSGWA